jgi:hypothetical protein
MPYADPVKEKAYKKKYRSTHKKEFKEYADRFYQNHIGALAKYGRKHLLKLKTEVMLHYTQIFDSAATEPQCANPFGEHKEPYTTLAALTIDHPNDNGAEERRKLFGTRLRAGAPFYRWLKKHNFPDGYRVLCFNCQWISRDKKLQRMTKKSL